MLVSKNYLSSRLNNFDISDEKLELELNNLAIEVENIKDLYVPGLKIGVIIECKKIPESKLSKAIVDIGSKKLQILCGCPTVINAKYVVVATPGTILPNDNVIMQRKILGYQSNGMICGLDEIGFNSAKIPDSLVDKIFHIPTELMDNFKPGDDANLLLGLNDKIIDISLTANRNDLNSQESIVKELTMFHSEKRKNKLEIELSYDQELTVNSEYLKGLASCKIDCKKHKVYQTAIELLKLNIKPTLTFQDFLTLLTINTGVTINGFIQPLNYIENSTIQINQLNIGLDYQELNNPSYLTFSVLEKNYAKVIAKREKLSNEYVSKSLKGIDASLISEAFRYMRHIFTLYAPDLKISKLIPHKCIGNSDKNIIVSSDYINKVLGSNYTPRALQKILNKKYLTSDVANILHVTIPKTRFDIHLPIDIVEEVAIIEGYDAIIPTPPIGNPINQAKEENPLNKKIKNICLAYGYDEVVTYNLVSQSDNNRWNPFSVEDQVQILKPISSDKEWMRTSLLFQMLRTYNFNLKQGNRNIKIFELSNISSLLNPNLNLCLVCGEEEKINSFSGEMIKTDFFYLKSLFNNIIAKLGVKSKFNFEYVDWDQEVLHPNKSAYIKLNNQIVGYIGEINPLIKEKNFKNLNVMEINIDKILKDSLKVIRAKNISPFPTVKKDFSFFLEKDKSVNDLFEQIKQLENIKDVEVFDLYTKNKQKSIAFSIFINSQYKTLTNEELRNIENKIINIITSQNGIIR